MTEVQTRKEMLLERRIRQRTRKPGFTPVPNKHIDARISATATLIQIGNPDITAEAAMATARREVAKTLPPRPIGYKTRFGSRSKY